MRDAAGTDIDKLGELCQNILNGRLKSVWQVVFAIESA
jgi:hypothetical protein